MRTKVIQWASDETPWICAYENGVCMSASPMNLLTTVSPHVWVAAVKKESK